MKSEIKLNDFTPSKLESIDLSFLKGLIAKEKYFRGANPTINTKVSIVLETVS